MLLAVDGRHYQPAGLPARRQPLKCWPVCSRQTRFFTHSWLTVSKSFSRAASFLSSTLSGESNPHLIILSGGLEADSLLLNDLVAGQVPLECLADVKV